MVSCDKMGQQGQTETWEIPLKSKIKQFSNSEALGQAQGAAESPSSEGLEPKRAMSEQQLCVSLLWAGVGLHKLQRSPPASAVPLLGGFK